MKMSKARITFDGDVTEQKFVLLVPGSKRLQNPNDPRGDIECIDSSTGQRFFVELKKLTLNQVRPNKYIVLVVFNPVTGDWYVIPPHHIMELCLDRRGQHTPDPIQCIGLGKITSQRWQKYKVSPSELPLAVQEAYLSGQRHTELRRLAESHKYDQEMGRLAYQSKLRSIVA